jgi:hypothetical protein
MSMRAVKGSFGIDMHANEDYFENNKVNMIDFNEINERDDIIEENLICFQKK